MIYRSEAAVHLVPRVTVGVAELRKMSKCEDTAVSQPYS
jgi:hypothetical protein